VPGTAGGAGLAAVSSPAPTLLAPRPPVLVGREGLLAGLDDRLAAAETQSGPRMVALRGPGGAGKTSVAVEYAHRHLPEVGMCWQFPAEDPTLLAAGFAELAGRLGVRELADPHDPVAAVHAVLARREAEWLVVFDNAPGWASVEAFVPPSGQGRVLITSQDRHWPCCQAVDVPVLDPEVAADFLVTRADDADRPAARDLALELGGLPLALELAAAYMEATATTLAAYLPMFRDRQAALLARGDAAELPAQVAAASGLALSRLDAESPAGAGLLRLLVFLAPEPVPLAPLLATGNAAGSLPAAAADAIGPLLGDPVASQDAITALRRFGMASPAGNGQVLVHPLVQAAIRAQLPEDPAGRWRQAAAAVVAAAVPANPKLATAWPVCAALLPHAQAVLDLTSAGMWRLATSVGSSGSYPVARDLFQRIADAYREDGDYGPEHPATLTARSNLARWTGQAGDAAGARDQFAALLPVRERVQGAEHPHTLAARSNLAYWAGRAGDAAGARDQFAALLPARERALGAEHPATLAARSNLAYWTGQAGDAAGARDQFAALLPVGERVLGTEHPASVAARSNLAHWAERARS
jgi:hypothetical protein